MVEILAELFLVAFDLVMFLLIVGILSFLWFLQAGMRLALNTELFSQVRKGGKPRVLLIGDSAAVGTGTTDRSQSLAGRLAADLPAASIENRSRIGLKAHTMKPVLEKLKGHYDLMIIIVGNNDVIRGTPLSVVEPNLHGLVAAAADHADTVALFTVNRLGDAPFFPRWLAPFINRRAASVSAMGRAAAANHSNVVYVDLQTPYRGQTPRSHPSYFAKDYLHLSEQGYALVYGKLVEAVKEASHLKFHRWSKNLKAPKISQTSRKNVNLRVWMLTDSFTKYSVQAARALRARVL